MSSAHLPSQVPVQSDYERGINKGLKMALDLAQRGFTIAELIEALQELAE